MASHNNNTASATATKTSTTKDVRFHLVRFFMDRILLFFASCKTNWMRNKNWWCWHKFKWKALEFDSDFQFTNYTMLLYTTFDCALCKLQYWNNCCPTNQTKEAYLVVSQRDLTSIMYAKAQRGYSIDTNMR